MKHHALLAAIAAVFVVAFTRADVTVTNITVRQQRPWNGLVDIDYEIVSDKPDASYWVYPKATDNRLGRGVVMNTLSGDGARTATTTARTMKAPMTMKMMKMGMKTSTTPRLCK